MSRKSTLFRLIKMVILKQIFTKNSDYFLAYFFLLSLGCSCYTQYIVSLNDGGQVLSLDIKKSPTNSNSWAPSIYGIINDVINGQPAPIDIQLFDISKCFNEIWHCETMNDIYDSGVLNDKFAMIAS